MRQPGEQRYAVIPPYPARWLLTEMASGRTVTKASAAAHAKWLRDHGGDQGRFFAGQVLGAWLQLEASALDGEPDEPSVLRPIRRDRPGFRVPEPPGGDGAA
ncbi:hypothetical protein [Phycicoccus sp.]|uniref:hypothetical protein n=1 Tax=Phycicoccus sp. TaxID=1902410 RepID=UPI002BEAF9B7|nr:hypothetical protein [Phycicoccus sp.]HMM96709.1 hypothetical protein [Phycicoccus sp.]